MPASITVELNLTCDESHGPWLHYGYHNDHIPKGQCGGSADFVDSTRARVKTKARQAGWKIPTKDDPSTICPHHNGTDPKSPRGMVGTTAPETESASS